MATSYANNSGTGERRPEIVITTNLVSSAGDLGGGVAFSSDDMGVLLDGITGAGGREGGTGNNGVAVNITFDWGVGAEGNIVIDEFTIYSTAATSYGTWTIDGSDNGSSWTTLKSGFTLSLINGSTAISFTNTTGYRFYRLNTTSASGYGGSTGFWREFEFKISDNSQTTRCSWFNTGGKGNRGATITVGGSLTVTAGTIQNTVDGDLTNNTTHAITLTTGQTTADLQFDFGSGNTSVKIDTILIWLSTNPGNANGTWKIQGSANGSSWTDIGATFSLTPVIAYTLAKHTVANTTGYRYYRLLQTAGTTSTPTILEVEFRVFGVGGGGGGGGGAKSVIIIGTCG